MDLAQGTRKQSDPAVVVRPSTKLLKPWYMLAFGLIAVIYGYNNNRTERMDWLIVFPALLLVWVAARHLSLRFVTMTVTGNKLRYETGIMSKSTRTMELVKVQDVHVSQTLFQRMLGIGNVTLETAGETGRLTMANVDNPQAVADFILESARR